MAPVNEVDEYIAAQSSEAQPMLTELRKIFKSVAPTATKKRAYGVVMYSYNGRQLAGFGAAQKHCAYYGSLGDFRKEFEAYKTGEGSVQFPLGTKIPAGLIKRAIKARMTEIETQSK